MEETFFSGPACILYFPHHPRRMGRREKVRLFGGQGEKGVCMGFVFSFFF